jgi:hypothetical protein
VRALTKRDPVVPRVPGTPVTWWRTVPVVILAPTIATALAVTWVESNTILAAWFGNAGAFQRLALTCHEAGQLSHIRFRTVNPNPLYP